MYKTVNIKIQYCKYYNNHNIVILTRDEKPPMDLKLLNSLNLKRRQLLMENNEIEAVKCSKYAFKWQCFNSQKKYYFESFY